MGRFLQNISTLVDEMMLHTPKSMSQYDKCQHGCQIGSLLHINKCKFEYPVRFELETSKSLVN